MRAQTVLLYKMLQVIDFKVAPVARSKGIVVSGGETKMKVEWTQGPESFMKKLNAINLYQVYAAEDFHEQFEVLAQIDLA